MLVLAARVGAGQTGAPGFDAHWHDGRAELDGYRWQGTRYGETRTGRAVMVYVTEPFSRSRLVKLDHPSRQPGDVLDVLKLNLIRDFQTGIYDYNTMVSVFARTSDFSPVKVSFSSAEWCGHVYDELRIRGRSIERQALSYFEGESAEERIRNQTGGVLEENLYILLRGLRGTYLEPGQVRDVPFLPSRFHERLSHGEFGWVRAAITRLESAERVEVPAGTFDSLVYEVRTPERVGRFHIERDHPHRIVRWEWAPRGGGAPLETAELAGTARLKYWQLHANGDESHLEELGLEPLP